MKKLLALALVLVFALSMTAVAFAAPAKTGSITINDSTTVSVSGKTFNAYKILDATLVDSTDASKGISYTVPAELADFYAKRYTLDAKADDFDVKVVEAIAKEEDKFEFAAAVLAAAKAAGVSPKSATAGDSVTSVTIDNLAIGYYVVEDKGAKTPISALIIDTTKPNVEVTIKAAKPSIDKKIDGNTDTDPSTKGEVESNNEAIGDKVPYIVKTSVPDMTGYKKYFFVVNDTLSKGLTFNDDVTITVAGKPLNKGTDFDVESAKLPSGETAVKIIFKDFYNKYKAQTNDEIVIKYSATLNEDAVIGTQGNPNKVNLQYSNNPNVTPHGDSQNPDKPAPEDKDIIGTTPDMITKTFVTGVEIHKVDEKGNHLAGAEFEIKGTRLNTVLVKTNTFEKNPEGTYYLLKNGTYTQTVPSDETADQYASITDKYAETTKVEKITKSEEVSYKGTVGPDGVLRFDGIAAGEYEITELKAPDGYNLLKKPVKITITCNLPENGEGTCTWTVTEPGKIVGDGIVKLDIVNKTGSILPSTGGMGTTILYVVGGILVVGAAILLFVKKRTSAAK